MPQTFRLTTIVLRMVEWSTEAHYQMSIRFEYQGWRVRVERGLPHDAKDGVIGLTRRRLESDEAVVNLREDLTEGTPLFHAVLVHEFIHAAGLLLPEEARDPLEEDLPGLVDELVRFALEEMDRDPYWAEDF